MQGARWHPTNARGITDRIVVEGDLLLREAAHVGSGERHDDSTDLPLLVDTVTGGPLLTGEALAGGLRAYLRSRTFGYRHPLPDLQDTAGMALEREGAAVRLLGGIPGDNTGGQGYLITEDARGVLPAADRVALRQGNAIDPHSGTARKGALYDRLCWPAGTVFRLRLELLHTGPMDDEERVCLRQALATTAAGLEEGAFRVGSRTRRGFGQAQVIRWRFKWYRLTTREGQRAWLYDRGAALAACEAVAVPDATALRTHLGVSVLLPDARHWFRVTTTFRLLPDAGLLIQGPMGARPAGKDDRYEGPDATHIHARVPGRTLNDPDRWEPVVPGTNTGGVLRAQATRILQTLAEDAWAHPRGGPDRYLRGQAHWFVERLFGPRLGGGRGDAEAWASRLETREAVIEDAETHLVPYHVSIDRHTMGPYEHSLYNENPVFGKEETRVVLELTIINPEEEEAGLLLQLVKDLWLADLALGGRKGTGYGLLHGIRSVVEHKQPNAATAVWEIQNANGRTIPTPSVTGPYLARPVLAVAPEAIRALTCYQEALNQFPWRMNTNDANQTRREVSRAHPARCSKEETLPSFAGADAVREWLEQQAADLDVRWLLAHAEEGVQWGRVVRSEEGVQLELSPEGVRELLAPAKLWDVRLFGPTAEVFLWRTEAGGFAARWIEDADEANVTWKDAIDEPYLLLGKSGRHIGVPPEWTQLTEGHDGALYQHVIPGRARLDGDGSTGALASPVALRVRHYVTPNGTATIVASRLVQLEQGGTEL